MEHIWIISNNPNTIKHVWACEHDDCHKVIQADSADSITRQVGAHILARHSS